MKKIDLSKYEDADRLPSDIERIIVNVIILYKGDIDNAAHMTHLSDDKINRVYLSWKSQIDKILKTHQNDEILSNGIDCGVEMMVNSINSMKEYMSKNDCTMISANSIKSINNTVDKLLKVKEQSTEAYDTLINKLNDSLLKAKNIEKIESGKIEDNSNYQSNINTVADLLSSYDSSSDKDISVPYTGNTKKIILTNVITHEKHTFDSAVKCASYLQVSQPSLICLKIRTNKLYKNKWKFEYGE